MITGFRGRASWAGRLVLAIDRVLTWGMEASDRESVLAEQAADWEAMSRDTSPIQRLRLIGRQLRGIPAAIWWRLTRTEITGLPVAGAMGVISLGLALEVAIPGYPLDHRLSLLLVAGGLAAASWRLIRQPRHIVIKEWRLIAIVLACGAAGTFLTFPSDDSWSAYDPEMALPIVDLLVGVASVALVVGFLALFAASFVEGRRRQTAMVAGILMMAGALLHATAQVLNGIWVSPIDLYATAVWFGSGLGLVLGAHMILRLRHLEIT
jgi:hypothetical protein